MLEAYRFHWASSFDGELDVKVTRSPEGCTVEIDRWFADPYDPVRQLGHAEWARLEAAMALARFWSPRAPQELMGFDGATWLIEGWKADRHHTIDLWSPSDPLIRSVGRTFADLAGFPELALY